MHSEEILKAVFPFLEAIELAKCMLVNKQWRDVIARDDYFWKCCCSRKCPSAVKRPSPPTLTYYELIKTFYRQPLHCMVLPPRLSFDNLEFYIDIWVDGKIAFSDVVPGPILNDRTWIPPPEISDSLKLHLKRHEDRMILPVEPSFTICLWKTVSVSVLVGCKDTKRVAWIIKESYLSYVDRRDKPELTSNYLDTLNVSTPICLFLHNTRAWVSLLCIDNCIKGEADVFAIEIDFYAANYADEKDGVLDWK